MSVATVNSHHNTLVDDFEVTGTSMPGSRLKNITRLAYKELGTLNIDDTVIIWGVHVTLITKVQMFDLSV
jgi:hypothetical protein